MIRNKKALLGTAAVMVTLSPLAMQQQQAQAATTKVSIQATINAPISFTKVDSMNFGILTTSAAGSVSLNFADTVANKAGGVFPAGGTPTSAELKVNAQNGATVVIDTTANTVTITNTTTADTLKIDSFDYSLVGVGTKAGGSPLTTTMTAAQHTLLIGADLNGFGTQKTGTYTGSFKIDVSYQ